MNIKILPIAIDLGAKNTGVFSAFYDKGLKLENLNNKAGKVYELSKDSYTLLMNNRTAKRHQRRGIDRKQLVKRLFRLIWNEKLNLEWDKNTQQAISFLLNRRGFSFLEEKHDASYFEKFPIEAIELLPQQLRLDKSSDEKYDLNSKIFETLENDTFKDVFVEIENNIKQVKKNIVKANIINIIKSAIDDKVSKGKIESTKQNKFDELKKVSSWIVEDIFDSEIFAYIDNVDNYSKNIFNYLNSLSNDQLEALRKSLATIDLNEYKNSVWNFNISNFNLDNEKLIEKLEAGDISAHLHHLGYALQNIKKELDEGSRHRSKYFEEVASVLLEQNHKEEYLRSFCQNLHAGKYINLNVKKLVNLIGNLSNLELKPLRKYFNDKAHTQADYWDEQKFAQTYCRWILGEWRVGSKDKDKKDGAKYSYKELCNDLKREVGTTQNIKSSIIEFLADLDPCRTIPPYQDNNNRKPPKCQSLILNPKFLDTKYPEWQSWLDKLKSIQSVKEYLAIFEDDLKDLKTGKGQPYFIETKSSNKQIASGQRDKKDLDARVLQFIFDRVKASDDLLLNEIYSQAKKVKQNASSEQDKQKAFNNLKAVLLDSHLSNELKPEGHFDKLSDLKNDIFEQGTFLHLVCKYYKQRQRARDSRLYIMPEYRHDKKLDKYNNTGRFDDDNQLLTYCNHKPRQKRYQLLNDIAGVLQVSPNLLKDKIGSDDELQIIEWLKNFKVASYCKAAVDMQKQYRGTLKNVAQTAIFKQRLEIIKKNKKASDEEKALVEKYKNAKALTSDENKLVKLVENIAKSSQKIGENLGLGDKQIAKFNSIYSFAQIQQIAFAERNGNANTCAVCSADNAHRMQIISALSQSKCDTQTSNVEASTSSAILDKTNISHNKVTELVEVKTDNTPNDFDKAQSSLGAKAQRLPAIPTRIVDGAVKKIATILARNIVDDNWHNIKQALYDKQQLHIPIITESNAFEFEPSLAEIKGTKKKDRISSQELFAKKENRIKNFSKGISAYSDTILADGDYDGSKEELDHIIPRSHKKYGTLNDEANLICVTRDDNQKRGNKAVYLSDLKPNYKSKQFGTTDNSQIEKYIAEKIWDAEKQDFKFGNYRSFINLTPEEQIAFRHALFLADENPIKQAVIKAIDNRNRTFVNGTQRYFAEVLANNIYLRAKKENLDTNKISFDYFGVPTTDSSGRGIADIRKLYEVIDSDIQAYAKGDKPQDSYSHLIDAMLAFCVAADEHKNDGSIGLEMDNQGGLFPTPDKYDENTGEILSWCDDDIFRKIKVADSEFGESKLARRKAYTVETNIRQEIQSRGDFKKSIPYKIHIDSLSAERFFPLLQISEDKWKYGFTLDNSVDIPKKDIELIQEFLTKSKEYKDYTVWIVNKTQAQEFLINIGYVGADKQQEKIAKLLDKLSYTTIKKEITSILAKANKTPDTVGDALDVIDELVFKTGKKNKLINFVKSEILLPVYNDWIKLKKAMQKADMNQNLHDFLSMYFITTNFKNKHQKVRKNFSLPVVSTIGTIRIRRKSWDGSDIYQVTGDESLAKYGFDGTVRPKTILSRNSVPIKYYNGKEKVVLIEPLSWINLDIDNLTDSSIISAQIKNRSAGQVSIKVELSSLDNICLKEDSWLGNIVYAGDKDKPNIIKGDKFYIKKEDFYWLKDFSLMFDSGKTKASLSIDKIGNSYILEFVSSKGKKEKQWLKNETPNS
ncbi:type II-B CRISPR-associated RNA-guided endonuclease Cas9/Csx12 [Francisella philomiragia]|uniref:type II-B CRISPR-associated RNA-guided endonuclease Cas9/Csx12 n=1 Tax=Francisella philomiragia TaxID=28110 RepID=UPI001B8BF704|nr:type II-B CRISPR-associated RNA-guided endonuclease Cas9/Csx12 [Francisella philomiragia]QUE30581.1 type II-B CRISPR-associated RNA-guided endonuclease Cas9/Csx12 [Francisella philomiragia]